jgi:hypothetical protein
LDSKARENTRCEAAAQSDRWPPDGFQDGWKGRALENMAPARFNRQAL